MTRRRKRKAEFERFFAELPPCCADQCTDCCIDDDKQEVFDFNEEDDNGS